MSQDDLVDLMAATPADAGLLANLLELYTYDLSVAFPQVALDANGRFGYAALPQYWSDPTNRFAFLIQRAQRPVGFVLATRGSPVSPDADVFDVAELFVLKACRRNGVARRAVELLWRRLAGRWTVRVSVRNPEALPFWRAVIDAYATTPAQHTTSPDWHVFRFTTSGASG